MEEQVELLDPEYLQPIDDEEEVEMSWDPPPNTQNWGWNTNFDIVTPEELEEVDDKGVSITERSPKDRIVFGDKELRLIRKSANRRLGSGSVLSGKGKDAAFVIIWNENTKRVLMARRSRKVNNPKKWNFFGGGIEKGETPIQAAVRELEEEAGINISQSNLYRLDVYKDLKSNRKLYYYLLRVDKKVRTSLNFEHDKAEWFELDDIPDKLNKPGKFGVGILKARIQLLELE